MRRGGRGGREGGRGGRGGGRGGGEGGRGGGRGEEVEEKEGRGLPGRTGGGGCAGRVEGEGCICKGDTSQSTACRANTAPTLPAH